MKLPTLDSLTLDSAQLFNQIKFSLTRDFVPFWRIKHQYQYGDWMFPRSWYFAIDTGCNRTCNYCPRSVKEYKRYEMTEEVMHKAIERFLEIKYDGIFGFNNINEPTLNKKLAWYISTVRRAFPKNFLRFNTNGDALTTKIMDAVLEAGINRVVITRHLPTSCEWGKKIAEIVRLYPFNVDYRGTIAGSPWLMFWGGASAPERIDHRPYCRIPHCNAMYIDFDGRVTQCQLDTNMTQVIGNVFEHGLLEMWNRPWFKSMRDEIRENRFIPKSDICKACLTPVYGQQEVIV